MKRYASFHKLKKAAEASRVSLGASPQAAETVIAFLHLVKQSIKPAQLPLAKSDD